VYGSLADLAGVLSQSTSPAPLLLPADARRGLANALCALFRTNLPPDVKAKLDVPEKPGFDVILRISEVHRQIAALHTELAELMVVASHPDAPRAAVKPQASTPKAMKPAPAKALIPPAGKKQAVMTEHQRMQAHVMRSFQGVNGSPDAASRALEKAWVSVLNDPLLHGATGISVTLFGSVGTPLVKERHGSLSKVLGMQLRKWCVLQAQAAGMKPRDVAGKPSNIRVR
jgi:hypothetical protein